MRIRVATLVPFLVLVFATLLLAFNIARPFVDYDEATYAKVMIDTIHSGDLVTLSHFGNPWFEKPPLYFWADLPFVKVFGPTETAFRLPAVAFSILCVWLAYLIVKKETGSWVAGVVGALALLSNPFFYFYAKEMRLDSGVLLTILTGLYIWLARDTQKHSLLWFFPVIAIGFLFKSVIALLLIPIIILYSLIRNQWLWIKDKYLWAGLLIAAGIWVPWHLIETIRFGSVFWNEYIGHQIVHRAINTLTGTGDIYDYITSFLKNDILWLAGILVSLGTYAWLLFKSGNRIALFRTLSPSLAAALGLFILFSLARTHLTPYVLPVFALLALFAGSLYHAFSEKVKDTGFADIPKYIFGAIILLNLTYLFAPQFQPFQFYTTDEVQIGHIYRSDNATSPAPLYSLNWEIFETLNYYGNTKTVNLDPHAVSGSLIKGPFYIVTDLGAGKYLFSDDTGTITSRFPNLKLLYYGKNLLLAYSSSDLLMPVLTIQDHPSSK